MCWGLLCFMQVLHTKCKRDRVSGWVRTCWLRAWDAQGGNWEDCGGLLRPRFCKDELTLACCAVLLQVMKKVSKPTKKAPKVERQRAKGTSSKVRPKSKKVSKLCFAAFMCHHTDV